VRAVSCPEPRSTLNRPLSLPEEVPHHRPAPVAPTPFLERPRKGGKKSPLAVVAVAPAGSTIEQGDCTGGDPELVGKTRALPAAASTAAAIVGVMDRVALRPELTL
jgi:hypothetical protein